MKEFFRKKIVALKRNTKIIPLLVMAFGFLYFSLNLTNMSNTTSKIQASGMGLSQFCIMLFSLLSFVCMLNAFPHRKPVKVPMLVLLYVMFAIIIYADYHYLGCINRSLNSATNSITITDSTMYILRAKSMLTVHMIIEAVCAALVALLPVYTKLIRSINTAVTIEDNGNMDQIELHE